MIYNAHLLLRLECALSPQHAERQIIPAKQKADAKGLVYWQAGPVGYGVTGLTEGACMGEERRRVRSIGNIPPSLARIPWC